MSDLIIEALALKHSPLPTTTELLKTLAVQIIWRYIGEGELQVNGTTAPLDPAVENARHFISMHLTEPLTLDTIAAASAISPAHLIRLFRAQLNTTPMNYLWERRVAMGIELLILRRGWEWEKLPHAAAFRPATISHGGSARRRVLLPLRCESNPGRATDVQPRILFTLALA